MPRTRSLAWSELKIGVLTIIAIVITAFTIFMLMGGRGFFWQRYTLKTKFTNVAGLKTGSPVRIAGVEVGSVEDVDVTGSDVDVVFQVNKNKSHLITSESVASLGSVSLLGESAVDITPSTQGTPVPPYGYVKTGKPVMALADVTTQASEGIGAITRLVSDISAGRGTVGKLMTDEALYTELHGFVNAANEMAQSVRQGRGTVGKLMNDPNTANALEASLRNMEAITRRINAGEGSLGKLMNDPAFSDSLTKATTNIRDLTDKINSGQGTVGKLMTDDALFTRINSITTRLDDLVNRLNAGEGTAGQLLKDKQLYENMSKTVAEMQALIADIRRDPKKYLNVKVSIF
jgi:phospholipid/cholesterol/gamma-HCH transport system substrate-binding protein